MVKLISARKPAGGGPRPPLAVPFLLAAFALGGLTTSAWALCSRP
jgi:hypothetical protein